MDINDNNNNPIDQTMGVGPDGSSDPGPVASPAPSPTGSGEFWFDEQSGEQAPRPKRSSRTWVMGGVGALVIAGVAVFGIQAASSSSTVTGAIAGNTSTQTGQGPGGGAMPGAMGTIGTITAIDGSTITLSARAGGPPGQSSSSTATTVSVTTTDSTTVSSAVAGSLPDIAVGDQISAMGTGSATALTATSVTDNGTNATTDIGGPGGGGFGGGGQGTPPGGSAGGAAGGGQPDTSRMRVAGKVTAIDGSAITVTTSTGTAKITVSPSTTYSTTETVALADLKVGDTAMVQGATSGSTVAATSIRIGAFGGPGGAS